jgi:hypothetical protein
MALVGYARISGRTLKHLVETIAELEQRQIGFRSLTEGIDTTTPQAGSPSTSSPPSPNSNGS